MENVCFTGNGVLVITGMLGALCTALIYVHKKLVAVLERELSICQQENQAWRQAAYDSTDIAKDAVGVAKTVRGLP